MDREFTMTTKQKRIWAAATVVILGLLIWTGALPAFYQYIFSYPAEVSVNTTWKKDGH